MYIYYVYICIYIYVYNSIYIYIRYIDGRMKVMRLSTTMSQCVCLTIATAKQNCIFFVFFQGVNYQEEYFTGVYDRYRYVDLIDYPRIMNIMGIF